MGLCTSIPEPSSRMGILWTISCIGGSAVLEFGSMGHMMYGQKWINQAGIPNCAPLYTAHITEKEIALGITSKLDKAIKEIVDSRNIKVIFVLPSSVPETIGMDIESVCNEIQMEYDDVKIIYFAKGGFREGLSDGIEEAMYRIVKHIPLDRYTKTKELTCNIVGSSIDFARYDSDINELKRMLQHAFSMKVQCVLTSDKLEDHDSIKRVNTSISSIEHMGESSINLVIRREGIKAAKELEKRFHTPYLYGRPYGVQGTITWLREIASTIQIEISEDYIKEELLSSQPQMKFVKQMVLSKGKSIKLLLASHADIVSGIGMFAIDEIGFTQVVMYTTQKKYQEERIPYIDEVSLKKEMETADIIMGSPYMIEETTKDRNMVLVRAINSWDFNPYSPPFLGFRGAINLCDIWLNFLFNM